MCPVAILGDRGAGKTAFLGSLYSAQVKYGTRRQDDFRFHAPLPSLKFMSGVYATLKEGRFPGATMKKQLDNVEFLFGYKRAVVGRLPWWIKKRAWMNPYSVLKFSAYDVSGEDLQEYIESGVAASDLVAKLLECRILAIIVDCSKMTTDLDSPEFKRMLKYDSDAAALLVAVQEHWRRDREKWIAKRYDPGRPVLYPTVILTKFDTLRDELLVQLGLHRGMPRVGDEARRREHAETLLRVFLPQTLAQLRGGKVAGVSFDQVAYFSSWIRIVLGEGGMAPVGAPKIIRKRISTEGGAEIDFSYSEYVGLIEHFRRLADAVPDDVKDADKLGIAPGAGAAKGKRK
jgi:hypothetical protein